MINTVGGGGGGYTWRGVVVGGVVVVGGQRLDVVPVEVVARRELLAVVSRGELADAVAPLELVDYAAPALRTRTLSHFNTRTIVLGIEPSYCEINDLLRKNGF